MDIVELIVFNSDRSFNADEMLLLSKSQRIVNLSPEFRKNKLSNDLVLKKAMAVSRIADEAPESLTLYYEGIPDAKLEFLAIWGHENSFDFNKRIVTVSKS